MSADLNTLRQRAAAVGATLEPKDGGFAIGHGAAAILVEDLGDVADHLAYIEAWRGLGIPAGGSEQ